MNFPRVCCIEDGFGISYKIFLSDVVSLMFNDRDECFKRLDLMLRGHDLKLAILNFGSDDVIVSKVSVMVLSCGGEYEIEIIDLTL
jgi:hypothetical protein